MEETWMLILSASFFVTLLLLSKLVSSKKPKHKNLPPSPPRLPILGHLHLIKEPVHGCFQKLSDKYGPIVYLSFGSLPVILVSSPSIVEECFTKNDVVLANRPHLQGGKYLHYNNTTIGSADYGEHWRKLRRLANLEIFSTSRLQMSGAIRQDEVRFLVKNLFRSCSGEGGFAKVKIKSRLSDLSFNIIMRIIAGKRYFGNEVADAEESGRIRNIIRDYFDFSAASNLGNYLQFLRWIDYQSYEKRLKKVRKDMDAFLDNLIEEHRNKRDGNSEKTLLDSVLSLQQSEPEYYSDDIVRGLIAVLVSAGSDTSSVTIEWAMALLLNHPIVLSKAREELDKHVGHDRLVDEADLSNLQYLQCIINETMRLFPAAPLLVPHVASEDCTIGGYGIPKGAVVFVNAWGLHRDANVWEDPLCFRPERFEGLDIDAFKFLPFGVGRRRCPGAGLAYKIVGLALAAMIQCFEWQRIGEEEVDLTEGTGLTMPKLEPLQVLCKPRTCMINVLSEL